MSDTRKCMQGLPAHRLYCYDLYCSECSYARRQEERWQERERWRLEPAWRKVLLILGWTLLAIPMLAFLLYLFAPVLLTLGALVVVIGVPILVVALVARVLLWPFR